MIEGRVEGAAMAGVMTLGGIEGLLLFKLRLPLFPTAKSSCCN